MPTPEQLQDLQEWYDEALRRDLFRKNSDLQEWGHEARRRGLIKDPTQGGLVTSKPAPSGPPVLPDARGADVGPVYKATAMREVYKPAPPVKPLTFFQPEAEKRVGILDQEINRFGQKYPITRRKGYREVPGGPLQQERQGLHIQRDALIAEWMKDAPKVYHDIQTQFDTAKKAGDVAGMKQAQKRLAFARRMEERYHQVQFKHTVNTPGGGLFSSGVEAEISPIHTGVLYPEEVKEKPWYEEVKQFVPWATGIGLVEPAGMDQARATLMMDGRYPVLPRLPGRTPQERQRQIQEKNDLLRAIKLAGGPKAFDRSGKVKDWRRFQGETGFGDPAVMNQYRQALLHPTPWQKQLLPTLLKQGDAELAAWALAGGDLQVVVESASEAIGPFLGRYIGKPLEEVVGKRLSKAVLAKAISQALRRGSSKMFPQLTEDVIRRAITHTVASTAANVAEGAIGGAITGGVLTGAATGDVKKAFESAVTSGAKAGVIGGAMGLATHAGFGALGKGVEKVRARIQPKLSEPVVEPHAGARFQYNGNEIRVREQSNEAISNVVRDLTDRQAAGEVLSPADEHALHTATQHLDKVNGYHNSRKINFPDQRTLDGYKNAWANQKDPHRQQYNVLKKAVQTVKDDEAKAIISEAAVDLERDFAFRYRRQLQEKGKIPFLEEGQPNAAQTPHVSAWRRLTPEQRAALPSDVQKVLLLQDISNSRTVLNPGEAPDTTVGKDVRSSASALRRQADELFERAQEEYQDGMVSAQRPVSAAVEAPAPVDMGEKLSLPAPEKAVVTPEVEQVAEVPQERRQDVGRKNESKSGFKSDYMYQRDKAYSRIREDYKAEHGGAEPSASYMNRQHGLVDELTEPNKDQATGLLSNESMIRTVKRAAEHSKASGEEAHYFEADIMNLGGLNQAISPGEADKVLKQLAAFLEDQFATREGVHLSFYKKGGDELGGVVVGMSEKDVLGALNRAKRAADQWIENAEVAGKRIKEVPHTKPGKAPGTGFVFGTTKIEEGDEPKVAIDRAAGLAERAKKTAQAEYQAKQELPAEVAKETPVVKSVKKAREKKVVTVNPDKPEEAGLPSGVRYHGSSMPVELGPTYYKRQDQNLFGPGFYTTDDIAIGQQYTKKGGGKEPSLYKVEWTGKNPPRMLDLEKPLPEEVHDLFQTEYNEYFSDNLDFSKPGTAIYRELKEAWAYEGLTRDDAQEAMESIVGRLEKLGYDGFAHQGGIKGGKKHNVEIYFNPVDEVSGNSNLKLTLIKGEEPASTPASTVKAEVPKPKTTPLDTLPDSASGTEDVIETTHNNIEGAPNADIGTRFKLYRHPNDLEAATVSVEVVGKTKDGWKVKVTGKTGHSTYLVGDTFNVSDKEADLGLTQTHVADKGIVYPDRAVIFHEHSPKLLKKGPTPLDTLPDPAKGTEPTLNPKLEEQVNARPPIEPKQGTRYHSAKGSGVVYEFVGPGEKEGSVKVKVVKSGRTGFKVGSILETKQTTLDEDFIQAPKGTRPGAIFTGDVKNQEVPGWGKPEDLLPESAEKSFKTSHVYREPLLDRFKAGATRLGHWFTRTYEGIPHTPEYEPLRQLFLEREAAGDQANTQALLAISQEVQGLSPSEYQTFNRAWTALDLEETVYKAREKYLEEHGTTDGFDENSILSEGWTYSDLISALVTVKQKMRPGDKVTNAILRVNKIREPIKNGLVEAYEAVTGRKLNLDRGFYQRHKVLAYATGQNVPIRGGAVKAKPGRSPLRERKGTQLPHETGFVESELDWMPTFVKDTVDLKILKRAHDDFDIMPEMKLANIELNKPETVKALESAAIGDLRNITDKTIDSLGDLAEEGVLPNRLDGKYTNLIDSLQALRDTNRELVKNGHTPLPMDAALSKQFQEYAKWATSRRTKAGKIKGNTIPKGYVEYRITDKSPIYRARTIAEQAFQDAQAASVSDILEISENKIREALMVGRRPDSMILPEGLVRTLMSMEKVSDPSFTNDLARVVRGIHTLWKWDKLYNPIHAAPYWLNNAISDINSLFEGHMLMSAGRRIPKSAKEIYDVVVRDKQPDADLQLWIDKGGFASLLTAREGEMGAVALKRLQKYYAVPPSKLSNALQTGKWLAQLPHDLREATLRYAAFKELMDQMRKSPQGRPKTFGASDAARVMALDRIEDRAWMISNQLLGAYNETTAAGRAMRNTVSPFWSWQEILVKRQAQLIKNAWDVPELAYDTGVKLSKGKLYGYRAYALGRFALKAAGLGYGLTAVNNLFHPEVEAQISDEDKWRPRLTTGYDRKTGKVGIIRNLGNFYQATRWFGLDNLGHYEDTYLNGRMTLDEIVKDMAINRPINELYQSMGPQFKIPGEILSGVSRFPEFSKPRSIRDPYEALFRQLSLDGLYRWANNIPGSKGLEGETYRQLTGKRETPGFWRKTLLGISTLDLGDGIYSDVRNDAQDWAEKQGDKQTKTQISAFSDRARYLYHARRALSVDDREAAYEYLARAGAETGLSDKDIVTSFMNMEPLHMFKPFTLKLYLSTLTESDQLKVRQAYLHWSTRYAPGASLETAMNEADTYKFVLRMRAATEGQLRKQHVISHKIKEEPEYKQKVMETRREQQKLRR